MQFSSRCKIACIIIVVAKALMPLSQLMDTFKLIAELGVTN